MVLEKLPIKHNIFDVIKDIATMEQAVLKFA